MTIFLIGCGCGTLTEDARAAIDGAGLLIGSRRLLDAYGDGKAQIEAVTAEAIAAAIREADCDPVCVLFSGDSGFYSGARLLLPLLTDYDTRVIPGVSSVQLFAARLQRPWQDWLLQSAHGTDCDPVEAVCHGRPVFFLTDGKQSPAQLCRGLTEAGLGFLNVHTGEDLGTAHERITHGTAAELAERDFSPLNVMLAEPAPQPTRRVPGIPDAEFLRAEKIPMTKQEVRAAALAKLAVGPEDVCWDVGAGTGSVSVELALQCRAVYGIERDEAALALAEENRKRHGAWNLRLIPGEAPAALTGLPAPDAVFVGGSGGRLREILYAVHKINPGARVCVSAIALESLHDSLSILRELGYEIEVTQLALSRSRPAGGLTLMLAQNPVYLISGWAK
ncbi:MAG: precorrin-6y C5,15-methyltransferase (decarboxylating) subunit CbiE [Oscillospiraceae bacterium]|nr:precorrin-6y C5,15-methyltransferase (decarboxylating) subunit CbiE [Oscillospiraceae bacterium]